MPTEIQPCRGVHGSESQAEGLLVALHSLCGMIMPSQCALAVLAATFVAGSVTCSTLAGIH